MGGRGVLLAVRVKRCLGHMEHIPFLASHGLMACMGGGGARSPRPQGVQNLFPTGIPKI